MEVTAISLNRMHEFCLDYRHTVRTGGTPGPERDALFMEYQAITYAAGVARSHRYVPITPQ